MSKDTAYGNFKLQRIGTTRPDISEVSIGPTKIELGNITKFS